MPKQTTRREFLKLAGITSAGLALAACGADAARLPAPTDRLPTVLPSTAPTENIPTRPALLIEERVNAVIASYRDLGKYPFTDEQIEKIKQCVEYAQVKDEKLRLTRNYWLISQSKLVESQEPELAEMLGYTPLAFSEDGLNWNKPGLRDTTDIPIGAEYNEPDEDPMDLRPSTHEFDFGIINSLWGLSAFGDVTTGEKMSVFKFITIKPNGALVLDVPKLKPGWERYEGFWAKRAPYNRYADYKLIDQSGMGRKLIALPVIYPGSYDSDQLPKDFDRLTRDQALSLLDQYVTAFVSEYKNLFFAYVGVTEFGMANDMLMKQMGPEYIDTVYQSIRTADPSAVLILEHDGNHVPGTDMTELTLSTAFRLKEKNLIDYIASECHIDLTPKSPKSKSSTEMKTVLESYPVPVFLSSIDINTDGYKSNPRRFLIQGEKLKEILQPSVELGAPFVGFWGGFPDERSWIVNGGQPDAAPTPWGQGWQEKPMYFAAESVLLKYYYQGNQIGL